MIAILIQALVVLLVLCVAFYIIRIAATHFGVPAVFVQILGLILALIFLLWVLRLAGVSVG